MDFYNPPIFCSRCRREMESLFCFACAMSRLDDADIQASATEIRAIARRPADTSGPGNCLICGEYIPARTLAKLLPGGRLYAHVECVQQLVARLEATPQAPQPLAGEFLFDGVIEVG